MARTVRVSAVSSDFIILDPRVEDTRNVDRVRDYLAGLVAPVLPDRPDLLVLPEVCDRPDNFEMPRRLPYYEARGTRILDFFRGLAREHDCAIVYPTERRDDAGAWRNAAWVIGRDGEVRGVYDKMFVTFSQMDEEGFTCADGGAVLDTGLGRAGLAICFDLNFPHLLRDYGRARPELILFPSHFHGSFIGEYWAYAARAYLVGAIARQECYLVSPAGQVLARSTAARRFFTASINLDCCVVHCEWEEMGKLDALKKGYGTGVGICDAGFAGNFLITNETGGESAAGLARRAGLSLLDDYLRGREEAPSSWRGA